jgi:spore coat-associated protein N
MGISSKSTAFKVMASTALLGAAAATAGLGTFGTFTSTTSANHQASTGAVSIVLGTAGSATNRLTIGASGMVPGDTIQRAVQLSNTGNQGLASESLTTAATVSSLLDTDATNGLQMTVQSCPTAWTESGTAPAYTYSCSGTPTTVVASRSVIGSNVPLTGLNSMSSGGVDYLVVTLSFPSAAPNSFQGQSSTIDFTFSGVQRTGQSK